MSNLNRLFAGVLVVPALLLALGCASADRHVFESPAIAPKTVTLVDTVDGTTVWSKEIPADHKLVVDLDSPYEDEGAKPSAVPANKMTWTLYRMTKAETLTTETAELVATEDVALSGRPVHLIVDIREPEVVGDVVVETYESPAQPQAEEAVEQPAAEEQVEAATEQTETEAAEGAETAEGAASEAAAEAEQASDQGEMVK